MKKPILSLLFSLLFIQLYAQNSEWQVGVGLGSTQEIWVRNGRHPLYEVANTSGEGINYTYTAAGPIRLGYRSHETGKFMLGADFNYTNVEMMSNFTDGTSSISNFQSYALLASTAYKYTDKPNLILYSGFDFGVAYHRAVNANTERKISTLTGAYQVTFMGVRVGRELGAFAELGLGFNGFVNGGIFYRIF